ncbi:MAG: asparagine synthetase B, partial [Planctomycetota bacterium]
MCGFFGSIAPFGEVPGLTEADERRLLAALAHRGPDGRGVHRAQSVLFGHTRLAIRDPRHPGAAQPIATPCGRYALAYNGEIYNDDELRRWLAPDVLSRTEGRGFQTDCDAETMLWALAIHGANALDAVVGMYALSFHAIEAQEVLLARDPLGVKPLVWTQLESHGSASRRGIAFASEPRALLAHPGVEAAPDPHGIGAYLVTSRRTFHGRTLFRGIRTVEP